MKSYFNDEILNLFDRQVPPFRRCRCLPVGGRGHNKNEISFPARPALWQGSFIIVWFDSDMMHIRLLDGREISVPLEWFPKLRDATNEQGKKWRPIGRGVRIHWDELDEDISVAALLK